MILSFVNKQRRYSAEKVKNYQEICSRVMEAVASRPFLDKRMLKSGIVLSATVNFVGTDKIRLVKRDTPAAYPAKIRAGDETVTVFDPGFPLYWHVEDAQ